MIGRPSNYSPELAIAICDLIMDGWPIRQIATREEMPEAATIYRWLSRHEDFREQYARAKELQMERFQEEIVEIADDGTNDWIERQIGEDQTITVPDHEHINRSRLRVDTRKWLMSKMAPKKYGDKQHLEHSGNLTLEALVMESMKPKG